MPKHRSTPLPAHAAPAPPKPHLAEDDSATNPHKPHANPSLPQPHPCATATSIYLFPSDTPPPHRHKHVPAPHPSRVILHPGHLSLNLGKLHRSHARPSPGPLHQHHRIFTILSPVATAQTAPQPSPRRHHRARHREPLSRQSHFPPAEHVALQRPPASTTDRKAAPPNSGTATLSPDLTITPHRSPVPSAQSSEVTTAAVSTGGSSPEADLNGSHHLRRQ